MVPPPAVSDVFSIRLFWIGDPGGASWRCRDSIIEMELESGAESYTKRTAESSIADEAQDLAGCLGTDSRDVGGSSNIQPGGI